MVIVNIIFLTFTVGFCIKAMSILIPMLVKELKEMEDTKY